MPSDKSLMVEEIDNIVDGQEVEKLVNLKLIAFLHDMKKKVKEDMSILKHWQLQFWNWKVPYVIQDNGETLALWKEDQTKDFDYKTIRRKKY